jgi:predicted ATPase
MILEIGSTAIMAGLAGYAFLKQKGPATNDAEKIQKIFTNCGWNGKNGETIRLHRKRRFKGGVEYVYQLPLGFNRKEIERNRHILEDGLNVKQSAFEFDKEDLLKVKIGKGMIEDIKKILTTKKTARKEIDFDFDGMFKIRVYDEKMPDKIPWAENMFKSGSWSVAVGCTRNETIYLDFDERKHLIVAGATGGGKSVLVKAIITALMVQQPENVEFSLIDLKGGPSFARFRDCKQVKNLAVDVDEAAEVLENVKEQMEELNKKIVADGYEDIKEANVKKRHFIIIDEAADLVDHKPAMTTLKEIVRKGRSSGFYIIYTTQYPSVEAVPSQVKRNIPARLSFVLDSATASQTVLDATGAEELPEIPGRGIYKQTKLTTVQTPYMSNQDIEKYIAPFKRRGKDEQKDNRKGATGGKHTINFEKV